MADDGSVIVGETSVWLGGVEDGLSGKIIGLADETGGTSGNIMLLVRVTEGCVRREVTYSI